MAVIPGKLMAVTGEGSIDMFQIETSVNMPPYTAGNHRGGVDRVDGNTDWKGVYRMYGHTPARFPGDSFTFVASPIQTAAQAVSGTARCTKLEVIWDVANGRYIESFVHFGANGALSTGAADPTDVTIPAALTSKGMTVNWNAGDIANVAYMKLTITGEDLPYVDSSATAGGTERMSGDVDCSAFWLVNNDDSGDFPTLAEQAIAKFFVTPASATFWEIDSMRIRGVEPWGADRRKKKPVQMLYTAEGSLWDGTNVGYIKNPAVATKWPV